MTTTLQVPAGDGGPGFELAMEKIYRAQQRLDEIAIVNDHKAPELISCFARAYADLTDYISRVTSEVVKAQNAVATRKATVLLDEAPRVLREKGVLSSRSPGGSEDQRQAVLDLDVVYCTLRDRLQQLEAYVALLKGKQKDIENGYLAVRKMFGESYSMRSSRLGSSMPPESATFHHFPEAQAAPSSLPRQPAKVATEDVVSTDDVRAQFGKVRD